MDAMMMEVRRDLPLLVLDIRKERGHITAWLRSCSWPVTEIDSDLSESVSHGM
jgi:hypothetical protein